MLTAGVITQALVVPSDAWVLLIKSQLPWGNMWKQEPLNWIYFWRKRMHVHVMFWNKSKLKKGKHRYSCSESNHSSVLVNLNDGENSENMHSEEPMTLVKDLFARQDKIVNMCNNYLFNQRMKLKNKLLMIELDNGSMNQCLINAVKTICFCV